MTLLRGCCLFALAMACYADTCYERFGSNRANCTSMKGECQWLEQHGQGECVEVERLGSWKVEDSCYARFGSDKTQCMQTNMTCHWLETDGVGKCTSMQHKQAHGTKVQLTEDEAVESGLQSETHINALDLALGVTVLCALLVCAACLFRKGWPVANKSASKTGKNKVSDTVEGITVKSDKPSEMASDDDDVVSVSTDTPSSEGNPNSGDNASNEDNQFTSELVDRV